MNESAELQRLIHHAAPLKSAEQTQEVFQAHGVVEGGGAIARVSAASPRRP